jgi:cytochrome c-type biogenesis protein CcmH/NrfG
VKVGVSGVDGPQDPYNPTPAPAQQPTEGTPEKKAEFYASLGTQQLGQGDTSNAAASFKKALELDPRNVAATTGMGETALRLGQFGDAISFLSKAGRLAPRNSMIFTLLGEAYLGSGSSGQAANAFKRALQLDSDNKRARDGYNEASSRTPPPSDD